MLAIVLTLPGTNFASSTIVVSIADNSVDQARRAVFYHSANNQYWAFYFNGTDTVCKYSSDNGKTWNTPVAGGNLVSGRGYPCLWSSDNIYIAYEKRDTANNSYDIIVRIGIVGADSITWNDEYIAIDGDSARKYHYPYLCLDASGFIWIAAVCEDSGNYYAVATKSRDSYSVSSWEDLQILSDTSNSNSFMRVCAAGDLGNYMWIFWKRDSVYEGKKCFRSAPWPIGWDTNPTTLGTGNAASDNQYHSAKNDTHNTVNFLYVDSNNDLICKRWNGTNWDAGTKINGDTGGVTYSNISKTTSDNLVAFWFSQDSKLYYQRWVNGIWDSQPTCWKYLSGH